MCCTAFYVPVEDVAPEAQVTPAPTVSARDVVKRFEDVVLGALLLVMFSWLLVAIALAVKLTSSGPVLFVQQRRGKGGQPFPCFKFRTMYQHQSDRVCRSQTKKNDPRVTKVGRVLRKYSLDELPQLLNVIRGEMSLIGPRPHALQTNVDGRLLAEIDADYMNRYVIKPGITGWAQVNGNRGILATDEQVHHRVRFDLEYIAKWSVFLDVAILFKTVSCVFDDKAF